MLNKLRLFVQEHPIKSSLLAGLFFGISFPPFPFPFQLFMPLAIAIWLRVIEQASDIRTALVRLFYGMVLANTVVSYWLSLATVAGGIAAVLAKAVVMTLMLLPFVWFHRKMESGKIAWFTALISSWVFAEGIDLYWDLSYPWLWAGNAWANLPILYQYISVTGVHGLSAWVVFLALLVHCSLFCLEEKSSPLRWPHLVVLMLPLMVSIGMYAARASLKSESTLKALLVQPNHDTYAEYSGFSSYNELVENLIEQTNEAIHPGIDRIYWPENALDPYIMNRAENVYQTMVQEAVDRWQIPLITGTTYREYYDATDSLNLPKVVRNRDSNYPLRLFNAAVEFRPNEAVKVYKKMRLVPLVEKLPFEEWLVQTHLFGINWEELSLFGKGKELTLFGPEMLNAPALICYDSAYPELGIHAVQQGAEYLAIITNDGWWGKSSGHIQHFVLSKLRAVESGRHILRAANNGISAVIDPRGVSHQETEFWTKTTISAEIPLLSHQTFFAKFGYWFVYLCFGLTALFLVRTSLFNIHA